MEVTMKNIIATLFSIFLFINASAAYSSDEVPNEFNITEHWISLTTSFDIETKTQKLGTLYRKFFSFLLTYEFFDPFDNKMATARSKFFSYTAHFDIYDRDERLLGIAEEKMFSFFPTFDIYAKDASTRLATASMNFWGTTFTIYDPASDQEMAVMHRSFFRMKNDWNIKITNRELFERKFIDFRVLMTVLAFQGDRENWEKDSKSNRFKGLKNNISSEDAASIVSDTEVNQLQEKIAAVSKQAGLGTVQKPDQRTLEQIATELEDNYKNTQADNLVTQTTQEKLNSFINYSLGLIESKEVPAEKKKAILYLLKMRLDGNV
jgi:uncharacterized protein YxjI